MISVVRSGKNPTMRHLERSHGVAVAWKRERDYMCLAYEVADRMASDIYTKAFSDSRKWKHACMQIGLLEPETLTDPETLKMVTSSFDPKKGTVQAAMPIMPHSCGTSHHPRCNVLLAHGGCAPLGFCAEDHGRKLRIVLNPRCNGSASTSTSSVHSA